MCSKQTASGNGGWKMGRSLWNSLITISRLFPVLSSLFPRFRQREKEREGKKGNPLNDRSLFIASKRDNRQIRNIHGCQAKFDTTNHPLNHPTALINPLGSIRLTNKLSAMPFQFESTGTASCIFRLVVERVYVLPSKTKINKSFIYLKNIFSSFYSLDTIIPSIRHIYIYFKISENRSLNYFSLENNSLTNLTHSHRVSSSRFRPVNVKRSILTAYMGKSPSPYVSRRPRYIYIYI